MSKVIIVYRGDQEFENLVTSLGYNIVGRVLFRNKINPRYYISKGKIDEIRELIRELSPERIIIDGILKSSQWYKLERELNIKVDDRIKLIIDIFANRARSKEAMLQVEYANLQYEISHIREIIHQIRLGEHPGFMGGGEYEIADYYERIRRKMAKIRRELEKMKIHREERRKRRREEGYILVGIAGYTNTGKSTLLKALSGRDVLIEDRMFSTLSTRTSRIGKEKILITDTVGFVHNMPPWLIKAFEPTLEEIYKSDIILLLLDCQDSTEEFTKKMELSLEIFESKSEGKIIPVINKIDSCNDIEEKFKIASEISEPVAISARDGIGIDLLIERIKREMRIENFYIEIDKEYSKVYQFIERYGKIIKLTPGEKLKIYFEMPVSKYEALKKLLIKNSTGSNGVLKEI